MVKKNVGLPVNREDMPPDHLSAAANGVRRTHYYLNPGEYEDFPLYTNGIEEVYRNAPTWYRNYHSRHAMAVMTDAGRIRYRINDELFELTPGSLLFIPQGTEYYFETTLDPCYHKFVAFILGVNLSGVLQTLKLDRVLLIKPSDPAQTIRQMRLLRILIRRGGVHHISRNAGLTLQLLSELSLAAHLPDQKSMTIRLACELLSGNYTIAKSIGETAAAVHMTPRSFDRMFRKHMQMSPQEYKLQCRVETARNLLRRTQMSIKEIAYELGFCNPFYFSSQFQKLTGQSPSEYRRAAKSVDK